MTPGALIYARFVVACTAGNLAAVAIVVVAAWLHEATLDVVPLPGSGVLAATWMTVAGAVAGAALGSVQHRALRWRYPTLPVRRFVVATAIVGAVVWLGGSLVPTLSWPGAGPEPRSIALFALASGIVAGPALGFAQTVALRGHARQRQWWFAGNALGWSTGAIWIFILASRGSTESTLQAVVVGVAAAALAGITAGLVAGLFLPLVTPTASAPGAPGDERCAAAG